MLPVCDTHGRMEKHAMSGWNRAPWPRDWILLLGETLGNRIPQNHSVRLLAVPARRDAIRSMGQAGNGTTFR